ncbi:MAG: hypothetical protein BWY57_01215 [Betaproteobacteria bacterium ADurb.Bin341]|nr:MAG: hypothetical protein BWY57_01215 [Betaproteobacteria bacterium ADurb.Bin341]
MKTARYLLFPCLLMSTAALAADTYQCVLIKDAGKDGYKQDATQRVELTIDGSNITQRIRIEAATKEVHFKTCTPLSKDGSNFSRWFESECRELGSTDGKSYMFEPFLYGAYAGISPVITPDYVLYKEIADASKSAGVAVPERTFIIYAERKPIYEFFCRKP